MTRTLLAFAIAAAPVAVSAATPLHVLEPVIAIGAGETIGSLNQGLLCLPKRALRVGDLGAIGHVAKDVAALYAGQGVEPMAGDHSVGALPDGVVAGRATLTITVTAVAATVCIPAYGIGYGRKARGQVTTLWRLFSADRRELFTRSYRTEFMTGRQRSDTGWRGAIMAAATQVVAATAALVR